MNNSFILRGDICHSKSPTQLEAWPDSYLICQNALCQGIFRTIPEPFSKLPVIDCRGKLILPGLTDLHLHAPQYVFRGLGLDLELLDWLDSYTFPGESRYREIDYAQSAYGQFTQDLRHSATTRACVFATVHRPATTLLMDLLEESGLVTMVGKVNMDRNCPQELREETAASVSETRRWLKACMGKYRNTLPILTPRFIPSCTDELLRSLGDLQREYALPVQSHLSENPREVALVKELCPDSHSYADAYDRFGLFGGDAATIMAHCVWVTQEEVSLMAHRGVYAAHCPQSNMNLSSGIAPVRKLLRAGVSVGLGSDVAAGCHTSIFRAMTDAIQVSKLRWRLMDPKDTPLSLEEVFYLGTVGGGSFFGKVGAFLPGWELDALVVDDSTLPSPTPLDIPQRLARVVYLADDRHIRQKYTRGNALL